MKNKNSKLMIERALNPYVAKEVGVDEAMLYENIKFWCVKNKKKNKHFHDGYYWTYNSRKAFVKSSFPYLNERRIKTIIAKLVKSKYIVLGNYNKNRWDQTNWYRINKMILANGNIIFAPKMPAKESHGQKGQVEWTKRTKG